jgi:ribosomal protein S18 acetylase RimI-like enzyme
MQNPEFKLEVLSPDNLSEFIKLTKTYFQEMDVVPEFHALDQDITQPLNIYAPPRGCIWLVRTLGQPHAVGMVGIMPLAKKTCELRRLYIMPEFRKRKWGKTLVDQALAFARKAEYFEVLVALSHDQKNALSMFERYGFKPVARYNEHQHAGIFLALKLNT